MHAYGVDSQGPGSTSHTESAVAGCATTGGKHTMLSQLAAVELLQQLNSPVPPAKAAPPASASPRPAGRPGAASSLPGWHPWTAAAAGAAAAAAEPQHCSLPLGSMQCSTRKRAFRLQDSGMGLRTHARTHTHTHSVMLSRVNTHTYTHCHPASLHSSKKLTVSRLPCSAVHTDWAVSGHGTASPSPARSAA